MKIGLFGAGLNTYWAQFEGLYQNLVGYQNQIKEKLGEFSNLEVVDAGIVDNPERAMVATKLFSEQDVDVVFLYVATYCLSSTILPIAKRIKRPVIILNLQPSSSVNYQYINSLEDRGLMTGLWLEHCQACSVPEITSVFNRAGIKYQIVTGYLNQPYAWEQIDQWVHAIKAYCEVRDNRMGILGHYYSGMLDVYTDITLQSSVFGTHFELLEMCELNKYVEEATNEQVNAKIDEFKSKFIVNAECEQSELVRAAKTSVALDKLVATHKLGSIAYYYEGIDGNSYESLSTSVIPGNTLLTGGGIPVAGECEVKNAHAMKIISALGGGGSFSEFYAMDFEDDVVLLGHDGPAHFGIADGNVGLVPLPIYHGKPGKGLSIQMSVKQGPVTLLSVCEGVNGVFLLVAEGESVEGETLQIGNTNSRYKFACGATNFINQWSQAGPSHHCAIGVGHLLEEIKKVAFLFNIPVVIVK